MLTGVNDIAIYSAINEIAEAKGRTEKEQALRDFAALGEGRRIIDWCYNPFITFGVTAKKEPEYRPKEMTSNWSQIGEVHNLLALLASRELTGNDAKAAVDAAFANLNSAAGNILWRCLNKDLKAGVAESSIKLVDPNLIPIFSVMRAHLYEERLVQKFPVAVEPKLDGNRVSFISRDGSGGFFTRTGKVIASLDHMVPATLETIKGWFQSSNGPFAGALTSTNGIPNLMLDGEMMSDKGFDELNGAMNRKTDVHGVSFHVFDCLSWEEFDAMGAVDVPYVDRRKRVNSIVAYATGIGRGHEICQTQIRLAHGHDDIQSIYADYRAQGYEGAMVKEPAGPYEKKKSRVWLKLKNEDTEDLQVIGVFQGQAGGKYEHTIGGLIVDRNGVEVRVSGIDDVTRAEIWELWLNACDAVSESPAVGYEGKTFGTTTTPGPLLGRLIEVEFHEVLASGSLRHPRFLRWRDDKTGEVDK